MRSLVTSTIIGLVVSTSVLSAGIHRPDAHAPIGVMADHMHKKGDLMTSNRTMLMSMKTLRQGTDDIADSAAGGMMVPLDMQMNMQMNGMMYGLNDNVTLMGMFMLMKNDMKMQVRATEAIVESGVFEIGDFKAGALIRLKDSESFKSHFGVMMSVPVGAVNHSSSGSTVGYMMQPGSGTFDVNPSVTMRWIQEKCSVGFQSSATIRTGKNHVGYALGNQINATAWWARILSDHVSGSVRLQGSIDTGITGEHSGIANPNMSVALNPDNSGRKIALAGIGLNAVIPKWKTFSPGVEVLIPVYEDLDGIQFKTETYLIFGSTLTF